MTDPTRTRIERINDTAKEQTSKEIGREDTLRFPPLEGTCYHLFTTPWLCNYSKYLWAINHAVTTAYLPLWEARF
jgi:hypothetical protein